MIPAVSYGNLTSSIFCGLAVAGLYFSYRKYRNQSVGYFLRFYFYLGIFFLLYAAPGIFFNDLILTEYSFQFALIFLYLALSYFISIPLELYYPRIRKYVFWLIVLLIPLVFVINLANFKPASEFYSSSLQYVFWDSLILPQIRYLTALVVALVSLGGAALFIVKGLKSEERFLKIRSLLIGSGVIMLMLASFLNYILIAMDPNSFFNNIASSLFAVAGLSLMLGSIYCKPSQREPFYHIKQG